ncbi:MAG: hypothetical protein INF50_06900 [Rhodobacter sp.]|nr:hypothetical protein [Rhodobacter sp.]
MAYGLPFGTPFGPIRTEPSDTVEHNINALCQRLARKLQVVAKLDPENRRAAAEGNAGLQAQRAQVATGEGFRAALRQEVERLAEDVATAHAGRGARRG